MSHGFKLSRRIARFRAPLFAVLVIAAFGCDNDNSFSPDSSTQPDAPLDEDGLLQAVPVDVPSAAVSFSGGVPFGMGAQPNSAFGSVYNGALRSIFPQYLLRDLAEIKARGGRVVLNMSGGMSRYTDRSGNFSLSEWKAQIDRYRNVNFDSYIKDGTIIGHYLIDEPHHASKYGGQAISGTTLEEMAKYSKQKYPDMPTIARTYPSYLEKWGPYRYLDAGWAPYVHRFGDVRKFLDSHVASAKKQGLGLVVGLNVLKGGPNNSKMSASQVKEWGTVLLSNGYPCAFLSWKYDNEYLSGSGVKDAMSQLRNRAQSQGSRSCRGS